MRLLFSKALLLSDLLASGEYYNFYRQIKDTVAESRDSHKKKGTNIPLNLPELALKSTSEGKNFTGNHLKRVREKVSMSLQSGSDSK